MAQWQKVQLSEVLIERKETPDPVALETGEIPIVSKIGFNTGQLAFRNSTATKSKMMQFQPGDLVFSSIAAANGAIALYPTDAQKPGSATTSYTAYSVDLERADSTFLWWLFRSATFQHLLYRVMPSGNRTQLKPKHLLPVSVSLPSLSEQRRIVAQINHVVTKIDEARVLREQAASELAALVNSVYRDALEPSEGWTIKSVSELCEKPQYGYTASAASEPIGPRLLRITDIQDNQVNWETVPYCDCPTPEKFLLHKDDILFARTGATTGKSFLVAECPTAVFASYLIRLRVREQVSPQYLYAFLQSPSYWEQISANTIGSAQPNCNGRKLATLQVPVAPPEEQRRIAAYLNQFQEKVSQIKALQVRTTEELDQLLPSILDKIFRQDG